MRALLTAIACIGAATLAAAQEPQLDGSAAAVSDPRFRDIAWREHSVVPLLTHLGYQTLIEFGPDEHIQNVALGDSASWQVTPNRAATLLFVKPLTADARTNMTVVTDRRVYAFALSSAEADGPGDPALVYGVRFSYPEAEAPPPAPPAPPRIVNADYAVRGASRFRTVRVFDDGALTYFLFEEGMEIPAIFAINDAGEEEMANTQSRPPYVVVDRLARGFVLRAGRERLQVRNNAYRARGADRPYGAAR